jgi:hypothetical protein
MNDLLKVALNVSIIIFVSGILGNKNINSSKFLNDYFITVSGFVAATFVSKVFADYIKKVDEKIGYKITGDIVGPIVIFGVKALFQPNSVNNKFYESLLLTIAGFTIFNIFIKEKIKSLKLDENVKNVLSTIAKPFLKAGVADIYKGENMFDLSNLKNNLYTVFGFLSAHIFNIIFQI